MKSRPHRIRTGLAAGALALALGACINYEEGNAVNAAGRSQESFNPPLAGTVYMRSDVLGKRDEQPTPVLTDVLNGARVSLSGKIVELRSDAVVLIYGESQRRVWIPRENVLAVTFDAPEAR
jgi:hypothetical protein